MDDVTLRDIPASFKKFLGMAFAAPYAARPQTVLFVRG
jgi:hypothetical protein